MHITETTEANLQHALEVERQAFGSEEEVELTRQLLLDASAVPRISLLAYEGDKPVGHILLTNSTLASEPDLQTMILAPLAVVPEHQRSGVGGELTREALAQAGEIGVGLVFVFGIPEYYPQHGFQAPAQPLGFEPPYRLAEGLEHGWMVCELSPGLIGKVAGRVVAADALMRPEYWEV